MTITRSVLLTMALAIAMSPACNERPNESQAIARPEQTRPPAAEVHAMATARTPLAMATERAPLATEPRLPASPTLDRVETTPADEGHVGLPISPKSARASESVCHARQTAPAEADLRTLIDQVQVRMDGELARARGIIVELQKANADLRQTLAAEREQLAELRKRLMSGRSIALQ